MRLFNAARLAIFMFIVIGFPVLSAFADEAAPIIKVNGTVLNQFHLNDIMNELIPSASFHGTVSPETLARYRPKAIDMLIEQELFYQEARRIGIKVDSRKIDEEMGKLTERLRGKKNLKAALKNEGITEREYEENLYRKFAVALFEEQEIKAKSVVTNDEVKLTYERNRDGYKRPESRKLSHILISVEPMATEKEVAERKKRAQEALDKIRNGEDFGKIAWDYSDDAFRVKGGDLGMVHRGRLDEDLEKVAFSLKKGELSGLIPTIYGFHIVHVDGVFEPVRLGLDEVSRTIRAKLEEDKRKNLRESILKRLKENAVIEVF